MRPIKHNVAAGRRWVLKAGVGTNCNEGRAGPGQNNASKIKEYLPDIHVVVVARDGQVARGLPWALQMKATEALVMN